MRKTYKDEIERHLAWNRKMFCPECGSHEYEVIKQLEPDTDLPWRIRCPQCGAEGYEAPSRKVAIAQWKVGLC